MILPNQALLSVLPSIRKLPESVLIDAVDLLANGPSSQLRVIAGRLGHWHGAVAALSSHLEVLELDLKLRGLI